MMGANGSLSVEHHHFFLVGFLIGGGVQGEGVTGEL